jgi:hypothetical protein
VARDESHAPVTHILTLVLLNAEKQSGCDGVPPMIAHTPRPDTVLAGAGGQLEMVADVTDAQSQVQSATLHWTRADATDPAHPPTFAATSLTRASATSTVWRAEVDVGAIPPEGTLVSYYLAATDNDDPTGIACDLTTRVPKVGTFTLALYPAGSPATLCIDDPVEDDDSLATAPRITPNHYAGRRLCGPEEDYMKVNADAGTTIAAGVTWDVLQGEVSLALVDESHAVLATGAVTEPGHVSLRYDQTSEQAVFLVAAATLPGTRVSYALDLAVDSAHCEDAPDEPGASSEGASDLALGGAREGTICPADADVFRVQATAGKTYVYRLTFDQRYGDLDFELRAADGTTVLGTAASERSVEELTHAATATGPLFLRVYGAAGGAGGGGAAGGVGPGAAGPGGVGGGGWGGGGGRGQHLHARRGGECGGVPARSVDRERDGGWSGGAVPGDVRGVHRVPVRARLVCGRSEWRRDARALDDGRGPGRAHAGAVRGPAGRAGSGSGGGGGRVRDHRLRGAAGGAVLLPGELGRGERDLQPDRGSAGSGRRVPARSAGAE